MGQHYHEGSACVIVWDDTVQEMEGKKVYPQNELYWGKPQVAHLKWKCTGTPIDVDKLNFPRPLAYLVNIRGEWHTQCNCIVLITVQSAEICVASKLEVKSGFVDLFGVEATRARMTLRPLLPDAGRGNRRRGMRWMMRITVTMTTKVEASKAGDMAAAAEAEGSARVIFRVGVST